VLSSDKRIRIRKLKKLRKT